jgi:hypothetical protein
MIARLETAIAQAEQMVEAGEKMVAEISALVVTLKEYHGEDAE